MLNFDKLLARLNRSVTEAFGENLVRNGDFSHNRLKDYKKWGTMQDTGDGSWYAEEGRIEIQKASGHGGTPAKYMRSTVLELDALTGRRGLGATESNATLTQQIEEITGPGTYRLSLDYRGAKSSRYGVEDTGTAEIWVGDKLVTVLSQGRPKWEERIIEFTLTEEDIPENGMVDLKLVSTGKADGRGAQLDNISLREIGETGLLGDELVKNGGFEDHPPMNRGRHGVFEELPGWEVSSDSVIELKSVRKPATPRDKKDAYIELDSHGPGSNSKVVQEIDVPEDGIYLLSFDYSPRGRGSKTKETSSVKVMAGDQVIAELSSDKVGWKPFTFNVDLVEGPLKLSFEGTGTQDTIGGLLDNVELRKVADLGPEPDPINTALDVPDDPEEAGHGYASGLLGEVHLADAVLTRLDQALSHVDDTPDATFVATEIDYGNHTGWFHNPLAKVLEHDADSLVGHADGALEQNVDHTVMQLTGEIYLEAGKHRFFNRTDDGFRLTIDGQEVAEFEGLRPARTTQGTIEVAEDGWYDIAVDYFEWKGHSKLRIEHRAPAGKREILDDDRLRHKIEDENGAPVAVDDTATTVDDTPVILDLLANDSDVDDDTLTIVNLGPVENGTLELNADGTVMISPDADFNGTVSFDYTISDGQAEATATATIEVIPVNDAPVAEDDSATTEEDQAITLDLLSNDSDPDGDALSIVELGPLEDGELSLNADGTVTFRPDADINGTVSFDYTISDGQAEAPATATIGVTPVNDAPVAADDLATTAEDTPVTIDLLANDSDPDGDALSIVDLGPVENGDLTLNPDGTVTFTPDADFNGTVSFDYTISDGAAQSTATATIEVTPVNDAPVASNDFGETEGVDPVNIDVLANDSDVDGDTLFIVDVGDSADGTIDPLSDGTLTFTANHGFAGTTSFQYTISDGAATDTAEVTIDVSQANRPPEPADDFVVTDEDTPVSFDLLANDSDLDGDALTIVDLDPVENGSLDLNADGTITFSPEADFNGTVSFDYTVSDGQAQSTATATVEVMPVNDPATAGEDSASTLEDTPVTMDLLANDADVDGDALSIVDLGPVENGALVLNPDGTATFTPDADFNGSVSFDYTISDGVDLSTGTATVEIVPVNDSLSAEDDWARVDEDRAISLNLTLNDRDVDRDDLFVVDLGPVENGTASLNPTGTVTFTPDRDFHGTASFDYTVSDGVFESSATVTIEVTPINDHPVAQADFGQTEGVASVILDVLANDSDVESDVLTIVDPGTSPDGTVELLSDGTIAFTANEGFFGTTTFLYTVSDGAATDTAEVTIEVLQQNRPPEPENDIVTMAEDTSITIDLLANDGDPDGDPLTITAFGPFLNGSLNNHGDGTVSFTPDADYAGYIVIGYTVADDEGLTAAAQLHIAVENVNDAPVAVADAVGMDRGDTVMVNVLANDIDIDSAGLELVSASSARGSVSIVDGRIIFDPLDDFAFLAVEESADEVISYTIRDDEGLEALGTLTVTVTAPRQDRVNESLSYTERGAGGDTTDLDGEAGFQAIGFVGLAGFDNNDRLSIDLDSRGGLGRSSARGDHGDNESAGPGGDGTSATVAGGLGGGASAELFNAFLTGNEYDDRLDVVVDAFAGRGGKGGDGGDGGDASPLGMHTVRQFGGGEITTDYGEGAAFDGGDGGDGADGADGGDAHARVRNGVFDGGDDDDDITVEVDAVAGNGGNGGGGGRAGDGGNDRPFGGSHVNESISGDGGNGGHGGDSFAEVDGAQMLGGSGDDRIELVVVSEAGKGGIGGQGGRSGEGQYLDTIFTNNGLFLPPEYEGELFAILGAAGDGGDSGDNGNAQAIVIGNLLDGGDGDDEILLEIIAETPDAVSGAAAGNSGVDGALTPEQTGDYTVHQIAGIAGAAGADGAAGSATIIATGNTISGGAGDDLIEIVAEAITQGTATLTFEGNTVNGGTGQDIADFSKFDVAMDFDLAAGTFAAGSGAGSNTIDGIEHLIATIYDDLVSGSGSAETLTGGEGSDTLAGGGGQDVFVFDEGDGADTIEDFSGDVIDLTSHTGALDFAGLDLTDTAEGALIAFATGDTILLRGIDAGQLAETNFAF